MKQLRTDWKMSEIVKPEDFNLIGEVVNELGKELANKADVGGLEEYPLELSEGITSGVAYYSKDTFNKVTIYASLTKATYFERGDISAQLPEGFRPKSEVHLPISLYTRQGTGEFFAGIIHVRENGEIAIYHSGDMIQFAYISVTYTAAQ